MKYKITPIFPGKCKITLQPVTEEEKEVTDADTLQLYYQAALTSKFGPKALLMSVDEMSARLEVTANYVMQGGTLGNM